MSLCCRVLLNVLSVNWLTPCRSLAVKKPRCFLSLLFTSVYSAIAVHAMPFSSTRKGTKVLFPPRVGFPNVGIFESGGHGRLGLDLKPY